MRSGKGHNVLPVAGELSGVKIGDAVIVTLSGIHGLRGIVPERDRERVGKVTALYAKTFEVQDKRFDWDGREYQTGNARVRIATSKDIAYHKGIADKERAKRDAEAAYDAREDVKLARSLDYTDHTQWLKLGLDELRRINALVLAANGKGGE